MLHILLVLWTQTIKYQSETALIRTFLLLDSLRLVFDYIFKLGKIWKKKKNINK